MSRTSSKGQKRLSKRGRKRLAYISLGLVFFIVLLIILGFRHYNKLKNPQDLFVPNEKGNDNIVDEEGIDINGQFDRNTINIMLVGLDRNTDRSKTENVFRTDTNILLSINLEKETVDMLSIPRDSYVTIANRGMKEKFNSAFVYGYLDGKEDRTASGYKNLLDTTKNLLGGLPIYYYIGVDMDVVVEIVEALGGVEIDVPQDATDAKRGVHVKKGLQIMNGETLLGYARHRRLKEGDIDRIRNQQNIIMSIFNTLKKSNKFKSLPKIYKSLTDNIDTNMNFNQLSALAVFAKDLNKENIRMHMLPGDFGEYNHISYWIVDQNKRVDLVEKLFKIRIQPDRQDPLWEVAESFYASISNNILDIGESGIISAEGSTNISSHKKFDYRDLRFASSNEDIARVNGDGVVVGLSPGQASISISINNLSQTIDVIVTGEIGGEGEGNNGRPPIEEPPKENPPEEEPPIEEPPIEEAPIEKPKDPIDKEEGNKDKDKENPKNDKEPIEEEPEYKG